MKISILFSDSIFKRNFGTLGAPAENLVLANLLDFGSGIPEIWFGSNSTIDTDLNIWKYPYGFRTQNLSTRGELVENLVLGNLLCFGSRICEIWFSSNFNIDSDLNMWKYPYGFRTQNLNEIWVPRENSPKTSLMQICSVSGPEFTKFGFVLILISIRT